MADILEDKNTTCPACGNADWTLRGQAKDFSVSGEWFELRECPKCHLLATHPQPGFDQLGKYYASEAYVSHSDTRKGLVNKLFHAARNFMMKKKLEWVTMASSKTSGRLLDVGAGTGHFAKYMQDHDWQVIALEPDDTARKVAAEKLNLELLPLEDLASQPTSVFDVITLWHVLEHVHDVNGYLNQFHSILKPDGVLIIAVPNHTSVDAKAYGLKWAAFDVPRHLWHFSPASMELLLQKNHFRLAQKMTMPLDGFYVSMLSEKYKDSGFLGMPSAFFSGMKSLMAGKKQVDRGSSIIYVAVKS